MSIIAIQTPGLIRDLLAYQALIVKVAHDYEGTLWLSYDAHFRSVAATMQYQAWSTPDQTIWSQYFSRALPRRVSSNVLAVGPYGQSNAEESERSVPAKTPSRKDRPLPYSRYAPICLRWNKEGCRIPRLHIQARLPLMPRTISRATMPHKRKRCTDVFTNECFISLPTDNGLYSRINNNCTACKEAECMCECGLDTIDELEFRELSNQQTMHYPYIEDLVALEHAPIIAPPDYHN